MSVHNPTWLALGVGDTHHRGLLNISGSKNPGAKRAKRAKRKLLLKLKGISYHLHKLGANRAKSKLIYRLKRLFVLCIDQGLRKLRGMLYRN